MFVHLVISLHESREKKEQATYASEIFKCQSQRKENIRTVNQFEKTRDMHSADDHNQGKARQRIKNRVHHQQTHSNMQWVIQPRKSRKQHKGYLKKSCGAVRKKKILKPKNVKYCNNRTENHDRCVLYSGRGSF